MNRVVGIYTLYYYNRTPPYYILYLYCTWVHTHVYIHESKTFKHSLKTIYYIKCVQSKSI